MLYSTATKVELIHKWTNAIEKLNQEIKHIEADKTMSKEQRAASIARRQRIISDHRASIKQAKEFIEQQQRKTRELYETYFNRQK